MNSMDQIVILDSFCEEKDLGVLFAINLKFGHHIFAIVCKANSITGIVRRSSNFLSYIRQLGKAQRRATKIVPGFRNYLYYERLTSLVCCTVAEEWT